VEKQRILVTVKTYPTLSRKYGETVCTAGVRPDGSWVRMYPVPFRRLDEKEQYSKFDWLECQLQRNKADVRPETFRPFDQQELQRVDHMDTSHNWRERRALLLGKARVYDTLDELIAGAKANELSLAVFKPRRIVDFVWEEEAREWDPERVREMREATNQLELFADNTWRETFKVIPKLPYSFSGSSRFRVMRSRAVNACAQHTKTLEVSEPSPGRRGQGQAARAVASRALTPSPVAGGTASTSCDGGASQLYTTDRIGRSSLVLRGGCAGVMGRELESC